MNRVLDGLDQMKGYSLILGQLAGDPIGRTKAP